MSVSTFTSDDDWKAPQVQDDGIWPFTPYDSPTDCSTPANNLKLDTYPMLMHIKATGFTDMYLHDLPLDALVKCSHHAPAINSMRSLVDVSAQDGYTKFSPKGDAGDRIKKAVCANLKYACENIVGAAAPDPNFAFGSTKGYFKINLASRDKSKTATLIIGTYTLEVDENTTVYTEKADDFFTDFNDLLDTSPFTLIKKGEPLS